MPSPSEPESTPNRGDWSVWPRSHSTPSSAPDRSAAHRQETDSRCISRPGRSSLPTRASIQTAEPSLRRRRLRGRGFRLDHLLRWCADEEGHCRLQMRADAPRSACDGSARNNGAHRPHSRRTAVHCAEALVSHVGGWHIALLVLVAIAVISDVGDRKAGIWVATAGRDVSGKGNGELRKNVGLSGDRLLVELVSRHQRRGCVGIRILADERPRRCRVVFARGADGEGVRTCP